MPHISTLKRSLGNSQHLAVYSCSLQFNLGVTGKYQRTGKTIMSIFQMIKLDD